MTTPDLSDPEIMQHIKAVQDGSERWMCLGYVPKSMNKIKFYESGNGGLEELREELSDSSIRYAYIRYEINNMNKFVYIAYCGDGVNGPIKGSFSGHAIEIGRILKPLHHQVNARNEDDVDEKSIISALNKATGASYDSGAKVQGSSKINVPTSVSQGRTAATQSNVSQKTFDKTDYNKKDESAQYWKSNSAPATKEPARPDRSEYNITTERENYWKDNATAPKTSAPISSSSTTSAPPSRTITNRFQQMTAAPQTEPVKPPPPRTTGNVANRFQPQQQQAPAAPTPAPKPKVAPKPPVVVRQPEPEPEPVYEEQQEQQYDQGYDQQEQQYDQGYDQQQEQQYDQGYDQQQEQSYDQGYDQQEQHYDESQQHYDDQQQGYDQHQEQAYDDQQQHYDDQQQQGYDQHQEQAYDESQQQYDDQQGYEQSDYPYATALYAYQGENEGDLSFAEGDSIKVLDQSDPSGWWQGELNGAVDTIIEGGQNVPRSRKREMNNVEKVHRPHDQLTDKKNTTNNSLMIEYLYQAVSNTADDNTTLTSSLLDDECNRPYTDNFATDKLMYSFWGIRTFFYALFFLINFGQVYLEIREKGRKLSTRLLVFTFQGTFCLCRVIGDIVHYNQPCEYRVGSWWYFCFSWGTFFLICSWIFITEFWTKMLYTFYIADDIHFENTSKVRKFFIFLITIFFCWEVSVTVLCVSTHEDWSLLEGIGFLVYMISFGSAVAVNGVGFVKALKQSSQKSSTFGRTIRNTKILLVTAAAIVLMTLAHDIAFVFVLDQHTYKYFPSEVSITFVIDGGQMIIVLYCLAGGKFKNYFLFKRTHIEKSNSSSKDLSNNKRGGGGGSGTGNISITISKQQESVAPFDGNSNVFIEMDDSNSKQQIIENNNNSNNNSKRMEEEINQLEVDSSTSNGDSN
ncbi:actin binding protein E [Cavenderia fasciculata]|uniref:Actin binding protein E n=1 Tax=Cavenderia fasciculata TaxID=261658 RepID=F4PWG3_CACFS|nr:actin binding protein E [Cavenderia fasciculata]EGG20327.1 actin binding protein E [Cavenderia fasciculata]|eukprot:XP_004367310.1 actin binding protein E [Cavenderia fasciculata]